MDGYIIEQTQREISIVKHIENTKKLNIIRRTTRNLQQRLDVLEGLWNEYKELNKTICSNVKGKEELPYFTEDWFNRVYDIYLNGKDDIEEMLVRHSVANTNEVNQTNNSISNTLNQSVGNSSFDIKLPRIQIPKFSGNYNEWSTFHDLFETLIHTNDKLSDVQKLHYLKTNLSGEAAQLVHHFHVTNANYLPAYQLLTSRYQNTRVLVNNYLKTLMSLATVTTESSSQIKKLLDVTNECLLALANLGVVVDNWDTFIIYITVQKLPHESHQLWEQSLSSQSTLPTFEQLKSFLESRFRTLEFISAKNPTNRLPHQSVKPSHTHTKTFSTTAKQSIVCAICSGEHIIKNCPSFLKLSGKEKLDTVKQKHLCINCLDPRHAVTQCRSRFSCFTCKRRHHSCLHDAYNTNPSQPKESTSKTSANSIAINSPENADDKQIDSHHCRKPETSILLATAIVKAETQTGIHYLRAFLDQGSQASFVTNDTSKRLGLKQNPTSCVVNGLSQSQTAISKSIVKICFSSCHNNAKFQVDAYVLESLTDVMPAKSIPKVSMPHIEGLVLADPQFAQPGKIDLLLGADIYPDLLLEGILLLHKTLYLGGSYPAR